MGPPWRFWRFQLFIPLGIMMIVNELYSLIHILNTSNPPPAQIWERRQAYCSHE